MLARIYQNIHSLYQGRMMIMLDYEDNVILITDLA